MKSLNTLIVKYLQFVIFIYIVENTINIRKLRNIVTNSLNIIFIIYSFIEKEDVNIL